MHADCRHDVSMRWSTVVVKLDKLLKLPKRQIFSRVLLKESCDPLCILSTHKRRTVKKDLSKLRLVNGDVVYFLAKDVCILLALCWGSTSAKLVEDLKVDFLRWDVVVQGQNDWDSLANNFSKLVSALSVILKVGKELFWSKVILKTLDTSLATLANFVLCLSSPVGKDLCDLCASELARVHGSTCLAQDRSPSPIAANDNVVSRLSGYLQRLAEIWVKASIGTIS